jgi:hypothetical protein
MLGASLGEIICSGKTVRRSLDVRDFCGMAMGKN